MPAWLHAAPGSWERRRSSEGPHPGRRFLVAVRGFDARSGDTSIGVALRLDPLASPSLNQAHALGMPPRAAAVRGDARGSRGRLRGVDAVVRGASRAAWRRGARVPANHRLLAIARRARLEGEDLEQRRRARSGDTAAEGMEVGRRDPDGEPVGALRRQGGTGIRTGGLAIVRDLPEAASRSASSREAHSESAGSCSTRRPPLRSGRVANRYPDADATRNTGNPGAIRRRSSRDASRCTPSKNRPTSNPHRSR